MWVTEGDKEVPGIDSYWAGIVPDNGRDMHSFTVYSFVFFYCVGSYFEIILLLSKLCK
jgi:hypothetical protein